LLIGQLCIRGLHQRRRYQHEYGKSSGEMAHFSGSESFDHLEGTFGREDDGGPGTGDFTRRSPTGPGTPSPERGVSQRVWVRLYAGSRA
jgi:hypothetical protein